MRNIKQHGKDQSNHKRTIMLIVHIDAVLATCAIHLSVLAKFVSITQHSLTLLVHLAALVKSKQVEYLFVQ